MLRRYRLACVLGLLLSAAGAPAWAQCSDGDADGICDAADPCTNTSGATTDKALLRLRKIDGLAATRFYYVATINGLGNASVNPLADGVRLRVTVPGTPERSEIATIDVTLPPGGYDPQSNRGWSSNDAGTFAYRDSHGIYAGIMRALVKHVQGGALKIALFGQTGFYPVPFTAPPVDPRDDPFIPEVPIAATVVLDPPLATTGLCGEGVLTECRYRNRGRKLLCY